MQGAAIDITPTKVHGLSLGNLADHLELSELETLERIRPEIDAEDWQVYLSDAGLIQVRPTIRHVADVLLDTWPEGPGLKLSEARTCLSSALGLNITWGQVGLGVRQLLSRGKIEEVGEGTRVVFERL